MFSLEIPLRDEQLPPVRQRRKRKKKKSDAPLFAPIVHTTIETVNRGAVAVIPALDQSKLTAPGWGFRGTAMTPDGQTLYFWGSQGHAMWDNKPSSPDLVSALTYPEHKALVKLGIF